GAGQVYDRIGEIGAERVQTAVREIRDIEHPEHECQADTNERVEHSGRKTGQQLAGDQKGHESPCKARAIRVGSEQMLHWPSQADQCSISRSEPTDVLALVQLGRLLDRTLVYDRGQVVLVLHLGLRLRLENEVGPVDLVRFGIDRRFTEDGLALEVLKRLDRLLWLCTVGELNPGKDGMRHAV